MLTEMYSRSRGEGFGPEVKRRILLGTLYSARKPVRILLCTRLCACAP
jgi:Asp-tRNA(Asn)/Glu-tRNA(Gln) amidotransferase A subunit family amidase